jgi:hypothetical protein
MRDTRSYEIKRIIKKAFPNAIVKVFIDKYSMGESINIRTDLIKRTIVADPRGYGTVGYFTDEVKENLKHLELLLKDYQSVDRDEATGEILSGGNTYLFIDEL